MVRATDVAQYIVEEWGPIDALRLQKLCYYVQGWSLAWDGRPAFGERIAAWRYGPVCRALWNSHREERTLREIPGGDSARLPDSLKKTTDVVVDFYRNLPLVQLTHHEPPWLEAWGGRPLDSHGDDEITHEALREYFASFNQPYRRFTEPFRRGLEVLLDMTEEEARAHHRDEWVEAPELEEWLETGKGDPWAKSTASEA